MYDIPEITWREKKTHKISDESLDWKNFQWMSFHISKDREGRQRILLPRHKRKTKQQQEQEKKRKMKRKKKESPGISKDVENSKINSKD